MYLTSIKLFAVLNANSEIIMIILFPGKEYRKHYINSMDNSVRKHPSSNSHSTTSSHLGAVPFVFIN